MNQPQQEICSFCHEKLKQITKHLEDGTATTTKAHICTNPECPLSVEKSKVKTWK